MISWTLAEGDVLVVFDFDGTLSDDEMIVALGTHAGVGEEIAAVTDRAMAGEIDYATSLRRRVELLAGVPVSEAETALAGIRLRPGAAHLLQRLRDAGQTTAIVTGGFHRGVNEALTAAGVEVDAVIANEFAVEDGVMTGEVTGPLIEGTKETALTSLLERFDIDDRDTIAIGDGANDEPMLATAGLAIGFQPQPVIQDAVDVIVESMAALETEFTTRGILPS